jgi:N-glycosylase/DNA lyase
MQVFYFLKGDEVVERPIAVPEVCVLPGVPWGRADVLFTAAYWMTQYWMHEEGFPNRCHRLGQTFEEEVVACLLGGHGIPAELGIAAFERLRDRGLIAAAGTSIEVLADTLRQPLMLKGRSVVYRFWSQKARYVSSVLKSLQEEPAPVESPRALRDHLITLPGIGPKTASWIVRNWLGSNDVAILDIHVVRAGQLMGLFSTVDRVEQHYLKMESRFLALAEAMNVPAANLDSLIWQNMRNSPRLVAGLLEAQPGTGKPLNRRSHHLSTQGQLQPA